MAKSEIAPWFKPRSYAHFDKPLNDIAALKLVSDPIEVSKHSFLPMISFVLKEKRYKREKNLVQLKERPIAFCSHGDSAIFSYYSFLVSKEYEKKLEEYFLGNSIIAYRKFSEKRCNIDFANEVFNYISKKGNCSAIALDIEKFFDSISHEKLKSRIKNVLGVHHLADDYFAVFKAITCYSKVSQEKLCKALDIPVKEFKKFRSPLTTPKEFRQKVADAGLIEKNIASKGIPQGSPISALLANISLIDFDRKVSEICRAKGAIYRRYSDDLLVVCDSVDMEFFENKIEDLLKQESLEISVGKTIKSNFVKTKDILRADESLQYLGFEFDGTTKLVRSKSISRYHRKMRGAVRAAVRRAHYKRSGSDLKVFTRELLKRYSHLGKRNFLSYLKRASEKMGTREIKNQGRKNWKTLWKYLEQIKLKESEGRFPKTRKI